MIESRIPHTGAEVARERLGRDLIFPGALLALLFALIEHSLIGPVIEMRFRDASATAIGAVQTMMWAGTVLAPILFLIATIAFAALLWAMGQFLEEHGTFRAALNTCALAEALRLSMLLAVLLLARAGLSGDMSAAVATVLGTGFTQGDTLWRSVLRGLASPALWVWAVALGYLLRRRLSWSLGGAMVVPVALLLIRVLASAIRVQRSFIPN